MVDRKLYEIIKSILGEASIEQYPEKFSTRVTIQKILYFLTHGASNPQLNLSYKWNFYLPGPYSPEISQMIYHMNEVLEEIPNRNVELGKRECKAIEHFKKFKEDLDNNQLIERYLPELDESELYEIIATLTYLAGQMQAQKSTNLDKFKKFKPELDRKISHNTYDLLYSLLSKYGYI